MNSRYESAKALYAKVGIDTDRAIEILKEIPVSMHCWQGDDVTGFDKAGALSGGIQATGNYPGKATSPAELMADIDEAMRLIPGKKRLNLHANYAIFAEGEWVDRDELKPAHFKKWVDFAKERGIGLDFNPTMFSHLKAAEATLSSENEEIRKFWIRHCIACLHIAEYFAKELDSTVLVNIWIPDGFKDIPADRYSPRARLKASLDEILSCGYDKDKVLIAVESKVFGIGMESYTVGSHEFYMNYAAKNNIMCLLDSGHYHPTESVADKISSMLLFNDKMSLHVSRPVRWDSDHVIRLEDETKEIAKEIIANGHEKVLLATDFFDASINRVAAWVIGMRNLQKALLHALLMPHDILKNLQNDRNFTKLLMLSEELKTYPLGDVWEEYLHVCGVRAGIEWYNEIVSYEENVQSKRV